jgi:hypothetical protein
MQGVRLFPAAATTAAGVAWQAAQGSKATVIQQQQQQQQQQQRQRGVNLPITARTVIGSPRCSGPECSPVEVPQHCGALLPLQMQMLLLLLQQQGQLALMPLQ